jgi:uncharacterized protein (DUF1330 family)
MRKLLFSLLFLVTLSVSAQAKPAYSVAELTYVNKDLYQKELWPKIQKLVKEAGGQIIVAGGQGEGISGISHVADKVTIIRFKSYSQAKSFYSSKAYQDLKPLAEKAVKIKVFIIEGE